MLSFTSNLYIFIGFMLSILFLAFNLITTVFSYDFHLIKTFNLPSISNATDLVSLKNELFGVVSGNLSDCTITVLNQNEIVLKLKETGLTSQPKFNSSENIIFNKGYEILNNNVGSQNRLEIPNSQGDMIIGQNISYVYYSTAEKCPTLNRLTVQQNVISSKSFDNEQNCSFYSSGYLAHDESSTDSLLYAAKNKIYFVDGLLNFKNNYIEPNQTKDYQYSYIDSSFDNISSQLNILVRYSGSHFNNYRIISKIQDQFTAWTQIYNPTSNLYLISANEGVSINKNELYYWKNFKDSIVLTDFDTKNQSLEGTYGLGVSANQSLFMQVVETGLKLVLYKLQSFNITKLFEMEFLSVVFVVNGRFTKDNNNFIFTAFMQIGLATICNLDINQKNYSCLDYFRSYQTPNTSTRLKSQQLKAKTVDCNLYLCKQIEFMNSQKKISHQKENRFKRNNLGAGYIDCEFLTLFSAADRFVAICINYTSLYYEIHLYSITTAQLITTTLIDISGITNIYTFKFLLNQVKESIQDSSPMSFMIIFKVNGSYSLNDNAISVQYNIDNDEFIRTAVRSTDISFITSYAFGNYIVSFKSTYSQYNNSIKVFDYKTISALRSFSVYKGSISQNYRMDGSNKLLTVTQLYDFRATYVFDLSLGVQDPGFLRGLTFIQFYTEISYSYLLLPNQGYMYLFRTEASKTNQPLKQVYNLKQTGIQKIITMQSKYDITNTLSSVYLKKKQNIQGRQCGIAFSILNNKKLMKFKDCQPYSNAEYYDVDGDKKMNILKTGKIFESAQKQHIVIVLTQTTNKYTLIEVRNISNPDQLVWSYYRLSSELVNFATYYDKNGNDKILLNYQGFIIKRDIRTRIDAKDMNIKQIQNYEVKQKCYGLSGKTIESDGNDSIVIISKIPVSFTNITISLSAVRLLALSGDCNKVAFVTSNNHILVLNITTDPTQMLNQTITQIKDIKFMGSDAVFIEKNDGSIFIRHFNSSFHSGWYSTMFNPKAAVNENGDLYAVLVDQITVRIYTLQQQLIRQFQAKIVNGSLVLVGLSFADDNTLNIISQDGKLFVLSPTSCPQTFININGYCLCERNQSQVNNVCVCKKNFYSENDDCICNTQQFIYNNTDCLCTINASQVDNTCVCRSNFVKNGAQCLCNENQFQFKGSLCLCNYYATQVNDTCVCLKNFVKQGNQCNCPPSFEIRPLDRSCLCDYGFIQNNKCIQCSFPCQKCFGPGFSCDSYNGWFFVIIVFGSLLLMAIFGIALYKLKKKKKRNQAEQDESLLNSKQTNEIDSGKK